MDYLKIGILRYENEDRVEYQRIAEFLRLCGVYVWEQCMLFRGSVNAVANEERGMLLYEVQAQEGRAHEEGISMEKAVRNALERLRVEWKEALEGTEFLEAFEVLRDVFIKYDLVRAGTTLQFFRMSNELVEKAGDCFEEARAEIKRMMQEDRKLQLNRHVQYAAIYCGQRTNLGRELCELPVSVYVNILADECFDLIDDCPDFSNVWTLLGLVYEFTDEKIADSLDAFDRAVRKDGAYPFASSIYYWKGKRCENHSKGQEISRNAYVKAYELDNKYRNTYKRAIVSEKAGNLREAAGYYRECLRRLERKGTYLDPLEQEYFFKVSVKLGYIYLNVLNRTDDAIEILKEVLDFRARIEQGKEEPNDDTRYYFDLYGKDDAKEYIRLELERMKVRQTYGYLARAFGRLGMSAEEEKYLQLFNE